eukprot:XP_017945377.1 PREDICTED: uncharacterized protein LOC108645136 isoform X1 [Xenopus tropicalis]
MRQYLHTSLPVFLAGDFNQVLRPQDRTGTRVNNSEGFLNRIIQQADLVDVAIYNGRAGRHTYHCAGRSSRLDMAFVKKGESFTDVREQPVEYSDHFTVSFLWGASSIPSRGRGLWRLSTSVLAEESSKRIFMMRLQSEIGRVDFYDSVSSWWEDAKESFRTLFRKLSVRREGEKYKRYLSLRKKLEACISDGVDGSKLNQLKAEIRRHQYSRYRSLVLERDYGSFHSPDPFQNYRESVARKLVTGLMDTQGKLQNTREGILGVVRSYYADLFRNKALDGERLTDFLEVTPGPDTSNLDFSLLEAEITEAEGDGGNIFQPGVQGLAIVFVCWGGIKAIWTITRLCKFGLMNWWVGGFFFGLLPMDRGMDSAGRRVYGWVCDFRIC